MSDSRPEPPAMSLICLLDTFRVCHLLTYKWVVNLSLAILLFIAGPQVVGDLFLEVIRAFYSYCRDALGSDLQLSYTQSGSLLTRSGLGLPPHPLPPFQMP